MHLIEYGKNKPQSSGKHRDGTSVSILCCIERCFLLYAITKLLELDAIDEQVVPCFESFWKCKLDENGRI